MKKAIKRLCIAGLTSAASMNIICAGIFINAFGRKREKRVFMQSSRKRTDAPYEKIFLTSYDGLKLFGRLFVPEAAKKNPDAPTIILCIHGYHSDGLGDFAPFIPFYTDHGNILCLVDDRAHGQSSGHFIGFGYHDRFDCLTWVNYLVRRFGGTAGFSCTVSPWAEQRCFPAVMPAALPPQVKGIISDCAYSSGWEQIAMSYKPVYTFRPFCCSRSLIKSVRLWAATI